MMMFPRGIASALLQDLGGHAGADGAAAFADRKPQLLLHRDRRDQLDRHLRVVPRHHHLHAGGQLHRPRHVRRPQVKLRPIPLEERRMPPAFLLGQDVHLTLKLPVRRDAPRLRQHHPPLHLLVLHPAEQELNPVPRTPTSSPPPSTTGRASPDSGTADGRPRAGTPPVSKGSTPCARPLFSRKRTRAVAFTLPPKRTPPPCCLRRPATAEATRNAPSICAAP